MNQHYKEPLFDDSGINLADPNDRKGLKSQYITLLQSMALKKHLPPGDHEFALDVGCGFGRMAQSINSLGYQTIGIDPSLRVLKHAAERYPESKWCNGLLPDLPIQKHQCKLVCLLNVIRVLHLMDSIEMCTKIGDFVLPGGYIAIIDNIRKKDHRYVSKHWIIKTFSQNGFSLLKAIPIRAARWPHIFAIRYGLIPQRWFRKIASWELNAMQRRLKEPRWQYYNYLFLFKKNV